MSTSGRGRCRKSSSQHGNSISPTDKHEEKRFRATVINWKEREENRKRVRQRYWRTHNSWYTSCRYLNSLSLSFPFPLFYLFLEKERTFFFSCWRWSTYRTATAPATMSAIMWNWKRKLLYHLHCHFLLLDLFPPWSSFNSCRRRWSKNKP